MLHTSTHMLPCSFYYVASIFAWTRGLTHRAKLDSECVSLCACCVRCVMSAR